ncbi:hypothetical protein NQ315_011451 [Exocentrus adspersus]|uniref:Thaumatin-like protein n=1 Tax=Exocentrus adspersus TaxID=1586481 RepID=A0AAV8VUF5_9CUCU|nr:hypothetical protein NQ315_011451 [Exocentrus adspersus]
MFSETFIVTLLVAATYGRVLQVRNSGSVPLSVSVTGQDDVTVLTGATAFVTVPDDFSGSVTAVPVGSEGNDVPRTRAELTLGTTGDSYAVSLVEGFNLAAKIVPIQGAGCTTAVCSANLKARCPVADQVVDALGVVVACSNSPLVFSTVCPKAVVTAGDVTNVYTCQAQSYLILLG